MFKKIINKINPLDYKTNPYGSLMVELIFWILVIPFLGYVAGGLYVMYLFKENTFFIPWWFFFSLSLIIWLRLGIIINKYFYFKKKG